MKRFLVYGLSNNWGGVEAIITSIIIRLQDTCLFDIIVSNGICSYEDKYIAENVKFIHTMSWGENPKKFEKSLKVIFLQNTYDYVWINGCVMSNRTIVSATKKYSLARIITHSHGSSYEERNTLKRFVLLALHYLNRPFYYKNTDFPCMCSVKSGRWYYGERYVEKKHVHYVKNGIDLQRFRYDKNVRLKYRNLFGIDDELVLFHAGRLTSVKNQRFIIDILKRLLDERVNSKLFIAGDGELREELEEYANQRGVINNVCLLGSRDDVVGLYQMADIFLLPSFHEGFPVTLVEAQATGLPCVVSTGVSDETNLTGYVRYVSLRDDISVWVRNVVDLIDETIDRSNVYKRLYKLRYDIEQVANDFMTYIGNSTL